MAKDKIVVGITQGDTNGIGYEVIIKALADARILDSCIIILYGSSRFFGIYRKFLPEIEQVATNVINSAEDARTKRINIINAVPESMAMEIGQPTVDGAKAAVMALKAAVAELGFGFPGHTEYLIHEFERQDGLMFLISENLRVGVVTNHLPIAKVSAAINTETILSKLRLMDDSLRRDFGFVKPKIAVMGLNPHAGDGGSLGTEEIDIIEPAIRQANKEGILAFGPYSPDGFFSTHMQSNFEAVLAMYHDQGLIPFKALAFDSGVNFTAGLPIVRTSPDHGTGYDIAGKNKAWSGPMQKAIFAAIDLSLNRRKYAEIHANPLEERHFEGPRREKTILPE